MPSNEPLKILSPIGDTVLFWSDFLLFGLIGWGSGGGEVEVIDGWSIVCLAGIVSKLLDGLLLVLLLPCTYN